MGYKEPTLLQNSPKERICQLREQLKAERKKMLVASIIDSLKTYDPDSYCESGLPHVKFASEDFTDEEFDAFVELLHQNECLKHEVFYGNNKCKPDIKQCILRLNNEIILELRYYKEEYRGRWYDDHGPLPVIHWGCKDSSNYLIRLAEKDGKIYFKIYEGKCDWYGVRFESYSNDSRVDYRNPISLDEVLVPVSCDELERRYVEMCQKLDASLETTGTDDVRGQDSGEKKGKTLVKSLEEQLSFLGKAGSNS